jgi:putative ABC transport system permease protein
MNNLFQNLRYAVRMLLKSPGFTAVAIISLALGIGANTSIFSVANAVLWRSLPFKEPDRVMQMSLKADKPDKPAEANTMPVWAYPRFEVLRDHNQVFERVAAVSSQSFPLTETDNPQRLEVELVSASYFPLLGVTAAAGRGFTEEEDQKSNPQPVAVISHALWQSRYNSDPNLIGQTVSLNKVPLTVVGIMPRGFKGISASADLWAPFAMTPALTGIKRRLVQTGAFWHETIARLAPGITPAQAQADMQLVGRKMDEVLPAMRGIPSMTPEMVSIRDYKVEPVIKKSLLVLFAAVGFVLLIACVNIAGLLMARGVSRQKEIAIRFALGAGRRRIIGQLLTESLLLAFAGGLAGLLLSLWGIELLASFKPPSTSTFSATYIQILELNGAGIDGQVLAFNLLLSVATGILFGLMPAFGASRPDINESLKEGAGASGDMFRNLRRLSPRSALVVAEIALALVLLTGAGLMIKSFARMQAVPVGAATENILTLRAELARDTDREQLLARVEATPGVESASIASATPLSRSSSISVMKIEGRQDMLMIGVHSISPDYFETLRIPLLRGRGFTDQDHGKSKKVGIVNEAAARKYWPDEDPLGKRLAFASEPKPEDYVEIVGLAGDVKYGRIEEAVGPDVYVPYQQGMDRPSFIIARASNDPTRLVGAIRREVMSIDKNVPIYDVKTMAERAAQLTSRGRFGAVLLGLFAVMALVLAGVGIYGVMSYAVSGRQHEIGIRMALGATSTDVLRLVLGDGIILTALGLALGLVGAYNATQALSSQLYGVETTDAATFIIVSLVLATVALLASYIPARRATRVDPMVALRYE